ncbi:MAG: hypothetical protein BWY99_00921 [Synergistetes bacterium ADurb.BinA166]|nr:MAG: hypothetical protein BWY99_00921 [Synergistetes bacterium ADurb.BinA166]
MKATRPRNIILSVAGVRNLSAFIVPPTDSPRKIVVMFSISF